MRTPAPRRLVALGAVGSCLLAVGSFGVGAVPARLAGSWLHEAVSGRALSYGLVLAGVVGLLVAWWLLRGASARTTLTTAALWSAPLLVSVPLFSRDVFAYAGQGHLVDVGLDPYDHGPVDAPGPLSAEVDDVWADAVSPYGPVFLRVASWLVPGEHVLASVLLLRLLAVVGLALLAWSILRGARDPGRALWLVVANPLLLLHGISGVHNDLLMAGLLAAGLAVAMSAAEREAARRDGLLLAAAAVIVVAGLVKAPAVLALPFLPFVPPTARLRAAVAVGVGAVGTAFGVGAAMGLGWGWLDTLDAGSARRSLLSVSTGVGALASHVGGGGAVHTAQLAGRLVVVVLAAWLLVRVAPREPLRALGLALLAVAVLGPVVQPWYLFWALPALACVAGPRLAAGLAAASTVLCLLILPSGRHVIRPPLYGVPTLLVVAAGYAGASYLGRAKSPEGEGSGACADPRSP